MLRCTKRHELLVSPRIRNFSLTIVVYLVEKMCIKSDAIERQSHRREAMPCECQTAAMRVYRELRDSGQREDRAYEAAVVVYQHYHPDHERSDAYRVVADWLDLVDTEDQARATAI